VSRLAVPESDRPVLLAAARLTLDLPTEIQFGPGVRQQLAGWLAPRTSAVALFVGHSIATNAPASEIEPALADSGITVALRVITDGEPDDAAVADAAAGLRMSNVGAVIAIGGGSVIDLAKAAAVVADDPGVLERGLAGERILGRPSRPVVALPTTAGTGAETSHAAIVLDRRAAKKRGLRGRGVAAQIALVDPELAVSAPAEVTAAAGFDALAHAIETFSSRASHAFARALAADALPRLLRHVPAAMAEPTDLVSRSETAYAAMLMGMNLATATTCLPHRLQYPLGALTGVAHARGVAALMPAWLERTERWAPATLALLGRMSGLVEPGQDDQQAARAVVSRTIEFLEQIGLRLRLRDFGVSKSDLPALVDAVEGTVANDPGPVEREDLLALYAASI
jgi:alcohol dehydrogenase class IV